MFDQCMYWINGKRAYFVKLTSFTAVSVSFQYFADMLPTHIEDMHEEFFFLKKWCCTNLQGFELSYIQTAAHCGGYTVSLACSQFLVFSEKKILHAYLQYVGNISAKYWKETLTAVKEVNFTKYALLPFIQYMHWSNIA